MWIDSLGHHLIEFYLHWPLPFPSPLRPPTQPAEIILMVPSSPIWTDEWLTSIVYVAVVIVFIAQNVSFQHDVYLSRRLWRRGRRWLAEELIDFSFPVAGLSSFHTLVVVLNSRASLYRLLWPHWHPLKGVEDTTAKEYKLWKVVWLENVNTDSLIFHYAWAEWGWQMVVVLGIAVWFQTCFIKLLRNAICGSK